MSVPDPSSRTTWLTTTTILQRLRALDDAAWGAFVSRFRDPIVRFARRSGVGEHAEDIAQATLSTFVERVRSGHYEKDRGQLRSWLFGIARNEVRAIGRREGRALPVPDEEVALEAERADWEEEWERALLLKGLLRLREELEPDSFRCYVQVVLEGRPAREVGAALGLTPDAVSVRKHRAQERMTAILAELEQF